MLRRPPMLDAARTAAACATRAVPAAVFRDPAGWLMYTAALWLAGCVIPKLELTRGDADAGTIEAGVAEGCALDAEACSEAGRGGNGGNAGSTVRGGGSGGDRAGEAASSGARAGAGAGGRGGRESRGGRGGAGREAAGEGGAGTAGSGGAEMDGGVEGSAGAGGLGGTPGVGGESGAGTGGVVGQGGSAGAPPPPCFSWVDYRETEDFAPFTPLGSELNGIGMVDLYLCRARPEGRSQLQLGKAIRDYGCYGTYEDNGARVGFGVTGAFQVLQASAECVVFTPADAATPVDLGEPGAPLTACRGILEGEPYDGGVASGTELGEWVSTPSGARECWIQFFETSEGMDRGSRRLTESLELLEVAP